MRETTARIGLVHLHMIVIQPEPTSRLRLPLCTQTPCRCWETCNLAVGPHFSNNSRAAPRR